MHNGLEIDCNGKFRRDPINLVFTSNCKPCADGTTAVAVGTNYIHLPSIYRGVCIHPSIIVTRLHSQKQKSSTKSKIHACMSIYPFVSYMFKTLMNMLYPPLAINKCLLGASGYKATDRACLHLPLWSSLALPLKVSRLYLPPTQFVESCHLPHKI